MNNITVTNKELFNSTVIEVDTSSLSVGSDRAHGTIAIETKNDGWKEIQGEHGLNDYQDEYGFALTSE